MLPPGFTTPAVGLREMTGMPIVALATTEMPTVVANRVNGFAGTNVSELIGVMRELLKARELARQWGDAARRYALARFAIGRFVDDWMAALAFVTSL